MTIQEPFEYLSFGGTFSRTFSLWADRFDFFSSIAGVVLIPYALLAVTLGIVTAIWIIEDEEVPDFHPTHLPLVVFIFGLQFLIYTCATIIGKGAIVLGVSRMYVGQQSTFTECLRDSWAKKAPLISATIIIGLTITILAIVAAIFIALPLAVSNPFTIFLAVMAGIVSLAVGLYVYIGTVLCVPAIMVEGFSGPIQGLKRSWELATGSRCYLFCTLGCLWFLNNMVQRLLHNMFVSGDIMDIMFSIAGLVVTILPLLFFFPLHAILETVMYLNLRIGRESMNHQVLAGDLSNDSSNSSRFRNDDPIISTEPSITSTDYRHVPLMDDEEYLAPLATSREMMT